MKLLPLILLCTACTAVPKKVEKDMEKPAPPLVTTDRESDYMDHYNKLAFVASTAILGWLLYQYFRDPDGKH